MTTLPNTKPRIESLDLLKGIVMVLMTLDHTRDYLYRPAVAASLTDPDQTTTALFITRWITHFCAPAFSLLAGISAYLSGQRKTKSELSVFLLKRGLWLILIELTIVNFAWYFDLQIRNLDFAVIWSLGFSMVCLAAIIHLPRTAILIFSLVIIATHNLLDRIQIQGNVWWALFHQFETIHVSENLMINFVYPIIPWIAVMPLGYYLGALYKKDFDPIRRRRILNRAGVATLILFFILRWTNLYGDVLKWKVYDDVGKTIMSFVSLTKYPVSLLYLMMTLGLTFIILANTETIKNKIVSFFATYGRVPFFYYIAHLYLIHITGMVFAEISGYGWQTLIQTSFVADFHGYGYPLWVTYAVWIGVVFALYPVCVWFDRVKKNNPQRWWLSYL